MTKTQSIAIQVLSFEQLVVQDSNNIASDMGGEKVILSIQNGKYYNLGVMGSQIWDLIKEPTAISNVINTLLQQFEVDREVCEEQVLSFLSHLLEEKLVHIKD